jgi:protein-S-isoprenylcysteine O-methyltransferase Ste14
MKALELRIPPPAVASAFALLMWGISRIAPHLQVAPALRIAVAVALALIGAGVALAGVRSFRRASTTIDPLKPETASALVSAGVYRRTRNPMYLGIVFVLLAWAVWLAAPWTLLGPLGFAVFIDRFQIVPEERALRARFGAAYERYRSEVRRWL